MSWRAVIISKRSKLDYKMGFLVVRNEDGESRIHIGDISVLVCETTAISITAYLIAELTAGKVKIVFCDNQHNPTAEVLPTHSAYNTSGRIRKQINWSSEAKANIWRAIVQRKIINQARNLAKAGLPDKCEQLMSYAAAVQPGDTSNREGHAAKVYFNNIFDETFYRGEDSVRNAVLNYGYSILLACFNREIVAAGYLTQIGIWHDNAENPFNLGSDLMESFRPLIDDFARTENFTKFETSEKHAVVNLLNSRVGINKSSQYLSNAVGVYVNSVFTALDANSPDKIMDWYEL